jgi:polyphenol oxidase
MSDIVYLQDEGLAALKSVRHGFFTRNGGVSEGLYASLNLGAGSDDAPAHVAENTRRVAEAMEVPSSHLATLYQCHSKRVVTLTEPLPAGDKPQADAMVTATPGIALGILTADCAPVLLADAKAGVIGACHAGWKGAIQNIMLETLMAMEALGAQRERIVAAVGPCIGQESYEVSQDFHDAFVAEAVANILFFEQGEREGHYLFDLPAYVRHTLQLCGVAQANVLAKDTCLLENAFFSNRRRNLRGEADYGRQVSVIVLAP